MKKGGDATRTVVCFGVYDRGKPRTRQMLASLRYAGFDVIEVHAELWSGIDDKARTTRLQRVSIAVRWLIAYPVLVARYLLAPRHRIVMVGYPGVFDVLVVRPLARLRGARIVFDAFISIYDTVVEDRQLLDAKGLFARLIRVTEGCACRAADLLILDTRSHVDYVGELYGVPESRRAAVMVGAEAGAFARLPPGPDRGSAITVLFYGQFIPLHGAETIVSAARLARDRGEDIDWLLIGIGQTAEQIDRNLAADPIPRLQRIDWVPYENLVGYLAEARIGLGIFGATGKADRVIPNKAFQIVASGRPLVTRDSPAMREWIGASITGVRLVPPGDAAALLAAIKELAVSGEVPEPALAESFAIDRLAHTYSALLEEVQQRHRRGICQG